MTQQQKDRIKADAEKYIHQMHGYVNDPQYDGYIAGASAEYERAEVLLDALVELFACFEPKDKLDKKAFLIAKQALLQWNQWNQGKEVEICTCDNQRIAAHGECYKCPCKHTRIRTAEVERAQVLVDILKRIKSFDSVNDLTKEFIDEALQKWEKGVDDEK